MKHFSYSFGMGACVCVRLCRSFVSCIHTSDWVANFTCDSWSFRFRTLSLSHSSALAFFGFFLFILWFCFIIFDLFDLVDTVSVSVSCHHSIHIVTIISLDELKCDICVCVLVRFGFICLHIANYLCRCHHSPLIWFNLKGCAVLTLFFSSSFPTHLEC